MTDFLIIGGGLIGMLSAIQLQKNGGSVTLLEKGELGRESSWAGGGILSPLYPWRYHDSVTALAQWSQQHYPEFFSALQDETGIDPQYRKSGLLVLDMDEREEALAWANRHGYHYQVLTEKEVAEMSPAVHAPEGAIWFPEIGQVRNPRLLAAVKKSLEIHDIDVHEHQAVASLLQEQGQVVGVRTADKEYRANKVVVCSGAWSPQVLGEATESLKIEPVMGQMIQFQAEPDLLSQIVLAHGHYLIPRSDGRILAGSTQEHCGFDKQITDTALEELKRFAVTVMPVLGEKEVVAHWAGLRPGSPQGIPYITEHQEIGGLYVNAGHYRNGVVTGLASVRLMTDMLLGKVSILPPEPYSWQQARGEGFQ